MEQGVLGIYPPSGTGGMGDEIPHGCMGDNPPGGCIPQNVCIPLYIHIRRIYV